MRYITATLFLFCITANLAAQADSFAVKRCIPSPDVYNHQPVYRVAEKMPVFETGPADFLKYVTKNMVYPVYEETIGLGTRFYITFIVDTLGKVQNACCITNQSYYTPEEKQIIALVQKTPDWTPAYLEDKKVCVRLVFPIIIHLK